MTNGSQSHAKMYFLELTSITYNDSIIHFFPQHGDLHFAQNLPGTADFYSYRNVWLLAPLMSFNRRRGNMVHLALGSRSPTIAATEARVFSFTPVVGPG